MRFALVVLVACSSTPRERTSISPAPDASVASLDARSGDDATTADVEPDRGQPPDPRPISCRSINGPNERFKKCLENDTVVELARPLKLEIQHRIAQGADASALVVGGGMNVGIDKSWSAMLLDARDREMVAATITKLERDRIELVTQIPLARVENFARAVRFTPLPNTRLTIVAPPPPPVVLRIKKHGTVSKRGTQIFVAGGSRKGIEKTWKAEVIDGGGAPLAPATVGRFDSDEIELFVPLTPDRLLSNASAIRFTPPSAP